MQTWWNAPSGFRLALIALPATEEFGEPSTRLQDSRMTLENAGALDPRPFRWSAWSTVF